MDFGSVIRFMDQQLKALKDLEDLIEHNENQEQTHGLEQEDIDSLKDYVAGMKQACSTAKTLAEHYKNAGSSQPDKTGPDQNAAGGEEAEKPKRRRSSAKKEEPPKQEEPPALKEEPAAETDNSSGFDFLD